MSDTSPASGCRLVGNAELARVFGVTPTTINRWERLGMPRERRAHYDLGKCLRWRFELLDRRASEAVPDPTVRLLNERTEGQRLANERFRAEHVSAAEADRALAFLANVVERELGTLVAESPTALAGAQTVAEVQDRLFAACRRARERIADAMDGYQVSE